MTLITSTERIGPSQAKAMLALTSWAELHQLKYTAVGPTREQWPELLQAEV